MRLPLDLEVETTFPAFADAVRRWLESLGAPLRDAVVLLPYAQLLAPARRAFGAGWMPRLETTLTLAAALGPAAPHDGEAPSFDIALDRLEAARMLRRWPWGRDWAQRRPRGFESAVAQLVTTTHALARAAHAVAPQRREAWWSSAREQLVEVAGPGERESALARVALAWAELAPAPATDRLFELRPSAWVQLRCGGPDALVDAVLASAEAPALCIDADRAPGDAVQAWLRSRAPRIARCRDFEDEAQSAAAQVLTELAQRHTPVALVANDRVVTRRIHALLARHGVPLADETGWRLSTTRAGAALMVWLRATRADASTDTLLDALTETAPRALPALDRALRRSGVALCRQVDAATLSPACAALWQATRDALEAYAAQPPQSLRGWLLAFDALLRSVGLRARLDEDAAGRQALEALGLDSPPDDHVAPALRLDDFAAWVDTRLEHASFVPPPGAAPAVVITPLERVPLRPFAALVMPACDHRHLGADAAPPGLLGQALEVRLGLPSRAERLAARRSAFWHALRVPRATLLHRAQQDDEPLTPSVLLERLALEWRTAAGQPLPAWQDPRRPRPPAYAPVARPAPRARALPARLSASNVDALRACPYRFFSRTVLRLDRLEELDEEVEKRDYGSWLHAVLHRFHRERVPGQSREQDRAALHAAAAAEGARLGLADAAAFLPYAASFNAFAERYLDWQLACDAAGQRWQDGELALASSPPALGGTELHGRIDRLDRAADGAALLIDYKTGASAGLADRVKHPLEDTQLAFYAALLGESRALRAQYLALDDARAIAVHEHPDVAASAAALLAGLGGELARLREGAALPALGAGRECEWCEARGLCRRDDWS